MKIDISSDIKNGEQSSSSVKAVLFDFGGVFTDSPFTAVENYGKQLGLTAEQVRLTVFGAYDHDSDHPWHCLERGEITLEQARDGILQQSREQGQEVDLYALFGHMAEKGVGEERRGGLVEYVQELKVQGYLLGIITNNVREFADGWRSLIPLVVDEVFDIVIDSCEVGMRKPDPAIFHHALSRLPGISASQAVFLDDYAGNVAAAAQIGMHTVHVNDDPDATINNLRQILES